MAIEVLTGLDPEQRLVAESLHGPVIVVAGAGTGKTRAITHRIAHAVHSDAHSAGSGLAVTFTNRAAGEMRSRLDRLEVTGVTVRTFHAASLAQLRHFWPSTIGGPFPELLTSKVRLIAAACRDVGLSPDRTRERDLASEIEWAGSSLVSTIDYAQAARAAGRGPIGSGAGELDPVGISQVMSAYQERKTAAGVIDFEDVLLCLLALLADNPEAADQVRNRYRWFTVDEYQDVTPAQEALLRSWLGESREVCVVGDPSQTIYSFAGASPDSMGRFLVANPESTRITLSRCYRCTPQVLAMANSLMAAASDATSVRLTSQRPDGVPVEVVNCSDDADEAITVAKRIGGLVASGVATSDIAVLIRTNAVSQPIEEALERCAIPYAMRGSERFFDRAEVREATLRIRGAASSDRAGDPQDDLVGRCGAVLAGMGWHADAPGGGPGGGAAQRERWESLAAMVSLAGEVQRAGGATLTDLAEELVRRADISHPPSSGGVTVSTLHASKGLEWPVVFLVGCSEGSLPIVHADTPERVAEERRLMYVGMTRARDRLVITWARTRIGSGRPRDPSRFLAEMKIRSALGSRGSPPSAVAGRSRIARRAGGRSPAKCGVCSRALVTPGELSLGRCQRCPPNANERLVGELRSWRRRTAGNKRPQHSSSCPMPRSRHLRSTGPATLAGCSRYRASGRPRRSATGPSSCPCSIQR